MTSIFNDPKGRRRRVVNTAICGGAIVLVATIVVIAIGASMSLGPLEAESNQPAASRPEAKVDLVAPSTKQPALRPLRNRSVQASRNRVMRLAFLAGDDYAAFSSLKANADKLDGIVANWVEVAARGAGLTLHQDSEKRKINDWLRRNASHIRLYSKVGLAGVRDKLPFWLARPDMRRHLVERLTAYVGKHGFAGIVIDGRDVPLSAQANFLRFLREFRAMVQPASIQTLVIVDADWSPTRLRAYPAYVDYVIAATHMRRGSDGFAAGAPAAQAWFEARLDSILTVVPQSKLIVAIGAYATDSDGVHDAKVFSAQRAWDLLAHNEAQLVFDGRSLNATFRYADSLGRNHRIWLLDAVSAFNQTKTALAADPAGLALWRLGNEDPGVWRSFARGRRPDEATVRALRTVAPGVGNYRDLRGHLLAEKAGSRGKRDVVYNPSLGLVTSQVLTKPPRTGVRTIWRSRFPDAVALTFDDGPDPRYTGRILDILRQKGVKATFYVIGRQILEAPDLIKRMYDEGHDIGNHTFSHLNVFDISASRLATELNSTARIVESIAGVRIQLFRPPYAGKDFSYLDSGPALARRSTRLGYMIGELGADAFDYWALDAKWITRSAINGVVRDKERVLLLHDGGGDREATVAALPMIIDQLRAAGLRFVTTHELVGLPRSTVMVPRATGSIIADTESGVWRIATSVAGWFGNAFPYIAIVTALLGMLRLAAIVLLALVQFFRNPARMVPEPYEGSIAAIVPAYNEAETIAKTVRSLLASTVAERLDVIVVDDGSTDRTAEIVRAEFGADPRIRFFNKPNGGKASALNFGIEQTTADIVVAIDGDTILMPDAIDQLIRHFNDPTIGAVAGNVIVGNSRSLIARFQSLEYLMSQNLDRRAFQLVNAIGVVPGAIGAWRRAAISQVGGYKSDTLAEDAELTQALLRRDWRVVTEPAARALTEAPETLAGFMKQRYRWMFGTLQVAFKNLGSLFEKPRGLSLVTIPNVVLFQFGFTLLAPIMDAVLLFSVFVIGQSLLFDIDATANSTLILIATYWLIFQFADLAAAIVAIELSQRRRYWALLPLVILQRFCYRQLLYVTAIRALLAALKGTLVGWQKLVRTGNVDATALISKTKTT